MPCNPNDFRTIGPTLPTWKLCSVLFVGYVLLFLDAKQHERKGADQRHSRPQVMCHQKDTKKWKRCATRSWGYLRYQRFCGRNFTQVNLPSLQLSLLLWYNHVDNYGCSKTPTIKEASMGGWTHRASHQSRWSSTASCIKLLTAF